VADNLKGQTNENKNNLTFGFILVDNGMRRPHIIDTYNYDGE
jgi:hypothetical protein